MVGPGDKVVRVVDGRHGALKVVWVCERKDQFEIEDDRGRGKWFDKKPFYSLW